MLPNQKAAIYLNLVELTEALKRETSLLFHYLESSGVLTFDERELISRESRFSAQELITLFNLLKTKDAGWTHILLFLKNNDQSSLADKLQNDADGKHTEKIHKRSTMEEFAVRLAQYYQLNYVHLPTMGESPKHVKDVWVPLQIDGRSEENLPADRIDHVELLKRLKSTEGRNVALIKGDPGMGKTTLTKKIAYDWAVNYGCTDSPQFSLVLAVPLRYAGKTDKLGQLAIDYLLSVPEMEDIDRADLTRGIKQLKSQLLVILDGLDEYRNYSDGPFKNMFAEPFQRLLSSSAYSNEPPPTTSFKLIITSRPYACERINEDFFPLRFAILPLSVEHLNEFVQLYCQTPNGAAKVAEYLETNAELVIQVPLILTFVCFLADSFQEIPTNMTCLYDSFVRQMVKRELQRRSLAKPINMEKWRESNVVIATSELAFTGSAANAFEFTSKSLEMCHVTNDSFVCGFLLHKLDLSRESLMAEFPHRSIQEFFAALHCYHLMLFDRQDVLPGAYQLILNHDSQVGRFLFGICSRVGQFDNMIDWLHPSLTTSAAACYPPATAINQFGPSLIDCSGDECSSLGQRLFESIGDLEKEIVSCWDQYTSTNYLLLLDRLSSSFKRSLHFDVLTGISEGRICDWFLADEERSACLVVVGHGGTLLEGRFDHIDILVTGEAGDDSSRIDLSIGKIKSLPPVRTMVMARGTSTGSKQSVTASISYRNDDMCSQLTTFRFMYPQADRDKLLGIIEKESSEALFKLDSYVAVDKTVTMAGTKNYQTYRKMVVTVQDQSVSQSELIFALIRLSLLPVDEPSAEPCEGSSSDQLTHCCCIKDKRSRDSRPLPPNSDLSIVRLDCSKRSYIRTSQETGPEAFTPLIMVGPPGSTKLLIGEFVHSNQKFKG